MKKTAFFLVPILLGGLCLSADAQAKSKRHRSMSSTSSGEEISAKLKVSPDLDAQLAKFRRVQMPYRSQGLTPRERQMVLKLVQASRYLEDIFWRQSDPEGLMLYEELAPSQHPRDLKLRRFLWINGGRFDLINENKPFVGDQPMPPGRGFYPQSLTQAQIDDYVAKHPERKDQIYNSLTVVRWHGQDLEGLPFRIAYRSFLEPAAKLLREAADLSDDPGFAKFLRLRADALLTDKYYASDIAWMELKDPKFDIIFAPYETYLDGLMGVKASYGVAVMIRNEEESKKLAVYQQYVSDIQDALPLPPEDRPSKKGHLTPMEVMDTPFRAGDLTHGYQAVADNLPNDPRIHQEKGSKKLFFKNFMDARVNYVILPIARKVMRPDQATKASAEGYMAATLMHEICHGLGPVFARQNGKQVDIRESIGPVYSGLEEAKADAVGMFALQWLIDHGVLPKERAQEYYASYLGGMFRTIRIGVAEAHGKAEMMEFNYLFEQKAFVRDSAGHYAVDFDRIPTAVAALAKELLEIEATGDRARAEAWFKKYDTMPADLKGTLQSVTDVPVEVDPVFSFPNRVQ